MKGHIRLGAETGAVVIIGLMKGQKKDCADPENTESILNGGWKPASPRRSGLR